MKVKLKQQNLNDNEPTGNTNGSGSLATEMIQLNDDLTEFGEISAFLNHALASSLSDQDWLDKIKIDGARRCANWLQIRQGQLHEDMKRIQERYLKESNPEQ